MLSILIPNGASQDILGSGGSPSRKTFSVNTTKLFAPHGQVSFLVQALSNGIKGHAFLSMLRDGLIEEQLIV